MNFMRVKMTRNKILINTSILVFTLIFNFNSLFANNDETSLWVENIGKSALSILGEQNIANNKNCIPIKISSAHRVACAPVTSV